ncbi:MAG: hypothetical protein OEZ10_07800 [Gammaproteobacteria bacterium]|nr:hypothetical protein [Gammaproteobacteria bacterium]
MELLSLTPGVLAVSITTPVCPGSTMSMLIAEYISRIGDIRQPASTGGADNFDGVLRSGIVVVLLA